MPRLEIKTDTQSGISLIGKPSDEPPRRVRSDQEKRRLAVNRIGTHNNYEN
jgi:hypothetical protein